MTAKGLVAAGLLLFAAGFGAGFLFGGGSPLPAPSPSEGSLSSAGPGPGVPAGASAPKPPTPATADSDALLRAWLKSLPAPEIPTGDAALTFTVRDAKGAPVPGVEIRVDPMGELTTIRPEAPLEEQMRDAARRTQWREKAARIGITDASGTLRLDGLSGKTFRFSASLAGRRIQRANGNREWASPGDRVELIATEACEARVEVLGPDGTPVEQATLRIVGSGVPPIFWSREKSVVTFPSGEWEVTAVAGPQGLLKSEPTKVNIVPGREPTPLTLRVASGPGIHGRILFPESLGAEALSVYLLRVGPGDSLDRTRVRSQGSEQRVIQRNHEYMFRDLAPGRYALGVNRYPGPETGLYFVEAVEVGEGLLEHDIEVPEPERSRCLVVRVLDPEGAVLRGATVSASYVEGDSWPILRGESSTPGTDGSLMVLLDQATGGRGGPDPATIPMRPEGRFRFVVRTQAWGTMRGEARPGPAPEATARFGIPSSLTVEVPGYVGSPWHGRLGAGLVSDDERGSRMYLGAAGEDLAARGSARFTAVQPGEYDFVLSLGGSRSRFEIARVPMVIGPGKVEARVPFPTLYPVKFSGATWYVHIRRREDNHHLGETDVPGPDGVAVCDGLPAGDYHAEQSGGSADFTLPGPEVVPLKGR